MLSLSWSKVLGMNSLIPESFAFPIVPGRIGVSHSSLKEYQGPRRKQRGLRDCHRYFIYGILKDMKFFKEWSTILFLF